jgi:hypothetical protein
VTCFFWPTIPPLFGAFFFLSARESSTRREIESVARYQREGKRRVVPARQRPL